MGAHGEGESAGRFKGDLKKAAFDTVYACLAALASMLLSQTNGTIFLAGSTVIFVGLIAFICWARKATRTSTVLDLDGQAVELRRIANKFLRASYIACVMIPVGVSIVWFGFKDEVLGKRSATVQPESSHPSGPIQPVAPGSEPDHLDVAEVGFLDYDGDCRAPRLDIKLTNRGVKSAFVKRVKVNIKKAWHLKETPQLTGVVVPPEHNYVVKLSPANAPKQIEISVSHGLRPDDFGRFTIQLEEDPWASSNTIYLVNVEIIANEKDDTYRSKDLLFLITQFGYHFPSKQEFNDLIRINASRGLKVDPDAFEKDLRGNRKMLIDVSTIEGTKSQSLKELIISAQTSDLGKDGK